LSTGEYHSSIPLQFKPYYIAISKSANLLLISDNNNHKVHLYSLFTKNNDSNNKLQLTLDNLNITKIKVIGSDKGEGNAQFYYPSGGEGNAKFNRPRGVAIHPTANYFVVADSHNSRVQFFSISGEFICSFKPGNSDNPLPFSYPSGICIHKKEHLIAISDGGNNNITLFQSPIFSQQNSSCQVC